MKYCRTASKPAVRKSLSSRRAWIEIQKYMNTYSKENVALLTEGVD